MGTTDNREVQIAALFALVASRIDSRLLFNAYKKTLSQLFNLDEESTDRITKLFYTDCWHDAILAHVTALDGKSKAENRACVRSTLMGMSQRAKDRHQRDLPPGSTMIDPDNHPNEPPIKMNGQKTEGD